MAHNARARSSAVLAGLTALAVGLIVGLPATQANAASINPTDPAVVAVGSGSYAASPPASTGVDGTVNQQLYIDKTQAGKPVPTNAWWTDLAVTKFSGNLWADPLVDQATVDGTKIYYPNRWSDDGAARVIESPITVGGQVVSTATDDVIMGDFEGTKLPANWTATGDAFAAPSAGSSKGQGNVTGFLGHGLINSSTDQKADGATGTLTSDSFTVDKKFISFMVGGGDRIDNEDVRLVIDGATVLKATGKNSEQLSWVNWDVSAYAGQTAHIQIVDDQNAGWAHVLADQFVRTNDVTDIEHRFDNKFQASAANALRWGDWSLSWRMPQVNGDQYIDATAARGEPYTWFEFSGVTPTVTVQPGATFAAADGSALTFPAKTDRFTVTQDGRSFGIHTAAESTFVKSGNTIEVTSTGDYLVISAIPTTGATLNDMHKYAFAVPRDTKMNYTYSTEKASVDETWAVTTDALQGTNHDTIQGWLPHEWRETTNNLQYQGFTYDSPRGQIKTTIGHDGWHLSYRFTGLTPFAPAPQVLGKTADYSADEMKAYVDSYSKITNYGGDTYWGGKDLQQFAEYMEMAKQIGDTDAYTKLKDSLTTALTDWFTYTPGEKEHYFARYPTWQALVGFSTSYGSEAFNDHHFHYGYFTLASALLSFEDPAWGQKYGAMATQVAKEYANWDRSDTQYPYMRTFDTWEGHSYAGGVSSGNGNNQESSSEAIQSWAGLYLLGTALGNDKMQAAGAMGYSTERAAVQEYYLNENGNPNATVNPNAVGATGPGTFSSAYKHTTTGIMFDSGQAYATYFSGDPAWIYGIQWMPTAPWFNYLGWDPTFSMSQLDDMFTDRIRSKADAVAGDTIAALSSAAKKWYGVGTEGGNPVTQDRNAAIGSLEDGIRNAYLHNPSLILAKDASNVLYDQASGTVMVSVAADGSLVFPATWWTPQTLPAALVPLQPPVDKPDSDARDWATGWPLFAALGTNYKPDLAVAKSLYGYEIDGYQAGNTADVKAAAKVYSTMGDAVGNVVLGYVAQANPDMYADVHSALVKTKDPVVTSNSMAGAVYYNAMSNRGLGIETLDRHTSDPLSQVYYNQAKNEYSYVLFNASDTQKGYTVYDHDRSIGTIQVPAHTEVTHHLDAALDHIVIAASTPAKTVTRGSSTTFTATGIDQYGATIALDNVTWKASAGGTIADDGTFTATKDADPVTITAASGDKTKTYPIRVGAAPVLSNVTVKPGFDRVVTGTQQAFTAIAADQYGDAIDAGSFTWAFTGNGSIDASGVLTAGAVSTGYVIATTGGVAGSAVVAVVPVPTDIAQGKPVTAKTQQGGNVAANAVDGQPGTRWESEFTDDQWLQVDLGATYDLNRVQIDWENAAASKYSIQVADSADGPWTTVKTVTKDKPTADDLAVKGTGRFVRMAGDTRTTQYGFSIFGFRVYGTVSSDAITPTKVLIAPRQLSVVSGDQQKFTAYAFDDNASGGASDALWTVTGGGSVAADGQFTAAGDGGQYIVTAKVGRVSTSGTVSVSTLADGPTDPQPALPSDPPVDPPTDSPTVPPTDPPLPGGGTAQNIAIGKPVAASSSENGGLVEANAVDGNDSSRWSSKFTDNEWLQVDLGAVVPITVVGFNWENSYAKKFLVQVRNAATDPWKTVVIENAGKGGDVSYDVNTSARFVRMTGVQRNSAYGYSIQEFRVFSTEGAASPDLATHQPTASSSNENESAGVKASNATDGDAGTRWSSGFTDAAWLSVDLGSVKAVHTAELSWENAHATKYRIEGRSTTNGAWETIASVDNSTGGKEAVTLSGNYRYIRMQGVKRSTPYGYSLFDFSVR